MFYLSCLYRGIQSRSELVDIGWYGTRERKVKAARVDQIVYHLGPSALESVKIMNEAGLEIDADGNILPGQEEVYDD